MCEDQVQGRRPSERLAFNPWITECLPFPFPSLTSRRLQHCDSGLLGQKELRDSGAI